LQAGGGQGRATDASATARASDETRSQSLSLTVAGGENQPGSETGLRRRKVVTAKAETAFPWGLGAVEHAARERTLLDVPRGGNGGSRSESVGSNFV
jgi:hypothetical protein